MRKQANAVFTIILIVVILQDQVMANLKRECRKESGVSWASLKRLKNGDMSQVDPKLKCYVKCFMVRNGILTDDSTVDIEKALRHLPKNLQDGSRRTLDGCKIIRGENSCDTAFQIARCYFQAQPEILQKISLV